MTHSLSHTCTTYQLLLVTYSKIISLSNFDKKKVVVLPDLNLVDSHPSWLDTTTWCKKWDVLSLNILDVGIIFLNPKHHSSSQCVEELLRGVS